MKDESLGERIARLRKENKLTQEELAEKFNISAQAVSKWENDASAPDISVLPDLSRTLGVSVDELLGNKTEPSSLVYKPEITSAEAEKLMIKVRVLSVDGDKVNVNLPLQLVKVLAAGAVEPRVSVGNSKAFSSIDWNEILQMVDKGLLGKIVDVESADGDKVEVFVE
ncbi:MAG: helix-turn-helix transcriptional regulator [Clostridia bacterium]|nr:helix-turn-helix transcriptional regulator [Clostridia bacterium]